MEACVRLEGLPALDLWDLVIEVFHPEETPDNKIKGKHSHAKQRGNPLSDTRPAQEQALQNLPTDIHTLLNVDYVPTTIPLGNNRAKMTILEDNDAVIKLLLKRRAPSMGHVARTHRVNLDWLLERAINDP